MFEKIKGLNTLKQLSLFLVSCGLLLNLTGCCTPGLTGSLPVTLHPQETANWCWAASGQMVMDYLGNNVSQCTEANNRFYRSDCCNLALCPYPDAPTYDTAGNCVGCACGGWPARSSPDGWPSRPSSPPPWSAARKWSQRRLLIMRRRPVSPSSALGSGSILPA